jgi:hypothetical protein
MHMQLVSKPWAKENWGHPATAPNLGSKTGSGPPNQIGSVAIAVVIDVGCPGSLLAQHHCILRLLIALDVLLRLGVGLVLLHLMRLCHLRTAGYAIDHEILLTPCLSDGMLELLAVFHSQDAGRARERYN